MITQEQIQNELSHLAKRIGAKYDQFPSICKLQGDRPNISISDDGTLSYEAYERGVEIYCYTFSNLDDLMYHTFKEIVPRLASNYAIEMEATGEDFNQPFFNKKIELMGKIKPEWSKRMEEEQNEKRF